jgi:hypothetical protein
MKLAQTPALLSVHQTEKFVPQKVKELFRRESYRLQLLSVQMTVKNQN